jgi:hypothetical protein
VTRRIEPDPLWRSRDLLTILTGALGVGRLPRLLARFVSIDAALSHERRTIILHAKHNVAH